MKQPDKLILQSLKNGPLLAGDLPAARVFDRSLLGEVPDEAVLNFDQKLGHLYEQALALLIQGSSSLECMASHLQVFDDDNRTLGEFDFILFDRQSQSHIHLELAVKFYLGIQTANGWRFPGPNANDTWNRKISHMQDHQFRLGESSEAKNLLKERFGIEQIETRQLVYGCLFFPAGCNEPEKPQFVSPDCRIGRWLYREQFDEYFGDAEEFVHIPKHLWPVQPSSGQNIFETVTAEALKSMATERCTMFAVKGDSDVRFLVPDDWG